MTVQAKLFPCPLCGGGLEIKSSKKGKPYVVCDGCGVQMFVRNQQGIRRFEKLVTDAESANIWQRLSGLAERYERQCPSCGKKFWIAEDLMKFDWFDGHFQGFKCPDPNCDGIAKAKGTS